MAAVRTHALAQALAQPIAYALTHALALALAHALALALAHAPASKTVSLGISSREDPITRPYLRIPS